MAVCLIACLERTLLVLRDFYEDSILIIIWLIIIVAVAAAAGLYLSQGNTPTPDAGPMPLEVPTTEAGTYVPVLFGTRSVTPILVWYGNVRIVKVKVPTASKK